MLRAINFLCRLFFLVNLPDAWPGELCTAEEEDKAARSIAAQLPRGEGLWSEAGAVRTVGKPEVGTPAPKATAVVGKPVQPEPEARASGPPPP